MSRKTPFPFGYYVTDESPAHVTGWIEAYEYHLADEYMSGDVESASYNEGRRSVYEDLLVTALGVPQEAMDTYWHRLPAPDVETPDLPDRSTILISIEQVNAWVGRRLSYEEWEALEQAIPDSSIPDAITALVAGASDEGTESDTFVCRSCGDEEHPLTATDESGVWCECGARLDTQRERILKDRS